MGVYPLLVHFHQRFKGIRIAPLRTLQQSSFIRTEHRLPSFFYYKIRLWGREVATTMIEPG